MRVHRAKLAALAALALGGFAVAGCDTQSNEDTDRGRILFIEQCGTCHILKEAATSATVGPDLDAAFADSRAVGMDSDTIEGVVAAQVENPRTTDPSDPAYMPAGLLEGQDLEDVSAYVAQVAGVPGIEPPQAAGGPGGQVFANNGCGSCHTFAAANASGTVGPDLDEVLSGQSDAQVEESIVDPDAEIASGFQAGVMPTNYGEAITPDDLKLLIEFLLESASK
jgi:mono/diheme cytochrome c family protein